MPSLRRHELASEAAVVPAVQSSPTVGRGILREPESWGANCDWIKVTREVSFMVQTHELHHASCMLDPHAFLGHSLLVHMAIREA